ncbi:MAG: S1 RNA-binding domain-containing protein, partial [Mariprofundaceae bacterium]|nr:S1 RNA-binding domain-containing protein [Mariprofundaceae bacterium]
MINDQNPTNEKNTAQDAALPAGAEEESFKQLFEASLKEKPALKRGESIKGFVVSVDSEVVTLDVGEKNEGTINASEFETIGSELPAVGDEIDVMVISAGGRDGVRLSVLEGRRQELWSGIDAALEAGETVEATVLREVKGGFRVNLGGLEAFMPRSEADIDARIAAESLIGQVCQVAIIEATRRPENIVVSRKQPLEKEQQARRAILLETIKVGDKVTGKVKRLADFGAFVDIGGVDALLHVSDM